MNYETVIINQVKQLNNYYRFFELSDAQDSDEQILKNEEQDSETYEVYDLNGKLIVQGLAHSVADFLKGMNKAFSELKYITLTNNQPIVLPKPGPGTTMVKGGGMLKDGGMLKYGG